ncbi:LysR family transcriptional regulator [Saxibacter everestensis]|uniref:LysR family transcriptional regulator n=1 Tax=Saxibacter everestensis TaxID=2909229 RepID=A0ABY8QRT2_9MICO|nr:LysR family transcriptional regulator [Brevibacteriaceae bacterium ZFBP1038]
MPRPFTLTQLRYFQAVAELESMTAASERLLVTQSAVSTAMSQLEQALGVQLFIRQRTRALKLTPAGHRFVNEVNAFLEQADSLYESAQGLAGALAGKLKVGVFAPLAPFRLPVILQAFEEQYPDIEVTLLEADLATLHAALLDGECEVALTYGLGLPAGFSSQVVEQIPPHILVSAEHPAARHPERKVTLKDFEHEPMIQLNLPHSREYYEHLFRLSGITPNVRHSFAGYETVRSFVAMGHGYAVLNQRLHDLTYAGGRTVAIALSDDLPAIDVMLVRPQGVQPTRRALAFEQACKRLYGRINLEQAARDSTSTGESPAAHKQNL